MPENILFAKNGDLDSIICLWGINRSTLGLMPKDAFKECIQKKWIIVAQLDNQLIGYLQFRYTARTQTLSIVHLCVDQQIRGKGLAERLLDFLVKEFRTKARGVKLTCRSDYSNAIRFWTRYNFQPKGKLPSRGADPNVHLVIWWYSFGREDLFSIQQNDKIKAVLDFNIIAKLMDVDPLDNSKEEVEQLKSDWLATEVQYFRASETTSEIFRDRNDIRRERSQLFIKDFPELNVDKASVKIIETELLTLYTGNSDNDRSDRRQIAETIISGFRYFVTLDEGILRQAARIQLRYQLKLVTPSTLIAEIDMAVNAEDYFPSKLSGNHFTISKLTADEKLSLDKLFLNTGAGEKRNAFIILLNELVARPSACIKVIKEKGNIVAVYGFDEFDENFLIPFIRTKQYSLRQTLFIQNITDLIKEAISKNKQFIIVTDPYLTDIEKEILTNQGFFETSEGFVRGLSSGLYRAQDLNEYLAPIFSRIPQLTGIVSVVSDLKNSGSYLESIQLEKLLWPLKISDSQIPCLIIPIKPFYAKELFDTKAAKSELFGVQPNLIWSNENVYYRHIQPNVESFPARILWYASADANSSRQKAIVASSYLNEVITGPAKEVYRKHQKFGVYSWSRDISRLVKGDAQKAIKVLRFSDSESFNQPVSLKRIKAILKNNDESDNNFQSPLRIKNNTFIEIYSFGTKKK